MILEDEEEANIEEFYKTIESDEFYSYYVEFLNLEILNTKSKLHLINFKNKLKEINSIIAGDFLNKIIIGVNRPQTFIATTKYSMFRALGEDFLLGAISQLILGAIKVWFLIHQLDYYRTYSIINEFLKNFQHVQIS